MVDVPLGQSALVRDLVHVGRIVTAVGKRSRRTHQDFAATLGGFGDIADTVAADAYRRRCESCAL
jgi:hypothetical protein